MSSYDQPNQLHLMRTPGLAPADAQAYHLLVTKWVSEQLMIESAWRDAQLLKLKPGETWCEHATGRPEAEVWSEGFAHEERFRLVRQLGGHVLKAGVDRCPLGGDRVQYGPAPADWPPAARP